MAVKIKLKRIGKIRNPQYRIVVADAHTKRDGRAIEEIGTYQPKQEPSLIQVNSERAQHWLSVGAQPTEPVRALLKVTGDWQKFKGELGAEGTLKVSEPRVDKKSVFEAAVKQASDEPKAGATTPKAKKRTRAEPKAAAEADAPADRPEAPAGEAGTVAAESGQGQPAPEAAAGADEG